MAYKTRVTLFIPDNFASGSFLEHYGNDMRKPYIFHRRDVKGKGIEYVHEFASLEEFQAKEKDIREGARNLRAPYTILTRFHLEEVADEKPAEQPLVQKPVVETATASSAEVVTTPAVQPETVAQPETPAPVTETVTPEPVAEVAMTPPASEDLPPGTVDESVPIAPAQPVPDRSPREVELRQWDEARLIAHVSENKIKVQGGVHGEGNRDRIIATILQHESGVVLSRSKAPDFKGPFDQPTLMALDMDTLRRVAEQHGNAAGLTPPTARKKIVEFILKIRG